MSAVDDDTMESEVLRPVRSAVASSVSPVAHWRLHRRAHQRPGASRRRGSIVVRHRREAPVLGSPLTSCSEDAVKQMAVGAQRPLGADVAIAGPARPDPTSRICQPVGTVWYGMAIIPGTSPRRSRHDCPSIASASAGFSTTAEHAANASCRLAELRRAFVAVVPPPSGLLGRIGEESCAGWRRPALDPRAASPPAVPRRRPFPERSQDRCRICPSASPSPSLGGGGAP